MKYIVGCIAFLFVFFAVLFLVSIGLTIVFPVKGGEVNMLTDWRGWVALGVALASAVQSWKSSVNR